MPSRLLALALLLITGVAVADVQTILGEAIRRYEAGEYAAAEKELARVVTAEPENQAAHYYLGMAYYYQGRTAEAIPWLERAAAGSEPLAGLDAFLAGLYLTVGEVWKALPYYTGAYRTDPNDETVAYGYALGLKDIGRGDEAKAIFRHLAAGTGEVADAARYELGAILVEEGAYVSAVKRFRAVSVDSPYAEAASAYAESLAAFTRPLNLFGSLECFYDDNPASSSSERLGQQARIGGSAGTAVTLMANTRHYELGDTVGAKLQYLFYGLFYHNDDAGAYEFVSHSIEPGLRWHAGRFIDLTLGMDWRAVYLGGQDYSTAIGGSLVAEWRKGRGRSVRLNATYTRTRYTDAYASGSAVSSLEYLDADSYGIGVGSDLNFGRSTLNLDYTFSYEDTLNRDDPRFGTWAADSRFRMHALAATFQSPLRGRLRGVSAIASANYSHRLHPVPQSGELYPSVAGQRLTIDLLVLGARLQVSPWKEADVNLAFGVERTESSSAATAFDYVRNRYFLQLSAFY